VSAAGQSFLDVTRGSRLCLFHASDVALRVGLSLCGDASDEVLGSGGVVARVVCVHGVGQQREAGNTLRAWWAPALCGGVGLAGGRLAEADVQCAFYGDLFRPAGRHLAPGDPLVRARELDGFERDLLAAWWAEAARTDSAVVAPDARTLAVRTPQGVQGALRALSGSRFFASLGERALLGDLRQVRDYLSEHEIRQQARQRVTDAVGEDTRVLVGHSLGSVVAYEALCANPGWPIRMLVTLGSPLGIPNLIFDRLQPAPLSVARAGSGPQGRWPGPARAWANVADRYDVVALVKDLRRAFGPGVDCWLVDNGATAHDARPYLTAVQTGRAILTGLDGASRINPGGGRN
jgi:pimeloyl-ACP methyl ester carboxylesterase